MQAFTADVHRRKFFKFDAVFVEIILDEAIESSDKRPKCWYRYVDNTFVIWSHGRKDEFSSQIHFKETGYIIGQTSRIIFTTTISISLKCLKLGMGSIHERIFVKSQNQRMRSQLYHST